MSDPRDDDIKAFLQRIHDTARAGGATDEELTRLDTLFSEDTTFLQLTNEEAGSWLRWFAGKAYESWAKQRETDEATNMRLGLLTLGVLQLVKNAHEMNAGQLTFKMDKVTLDGAEAGDWELKITALTGEGLDISELD